MIHTLIKDLRVKDAVEGVYLLQAVKPKETRVGKPYLVLALADKSGEIGGIMWNTDSIPVSPGAPVLLSGKVGVYSGNIQIEVSTIEAAPKEEVIPEMLFRVAPVAPEILLFRIRRTLATMIDHDYYALCERLVEQNCGKLLMAPGAISSHHACIGGLLMHISGMLGYAEFVVSQHSEAVDRDLLIAGIVLHDIGKLRSYEYSDWGVVYAHTSEGSVIGHAALSCEMVDEASKELHTPEDKLLMVKGLVLHHHSDLGYRVIPQPSVEATLLHQLDVLDSSLTYASERVRYQQDIQAAS